MARSLLLISLLALIFAGGVSAEIIHQEKSLYRDLYVEETDGLRCLKFRARGGRESSQSCISLDNPEVLALKYTQMVMSGLFLNRDPKKILVIGLGGGILPRALRGLYPDADITSIEIDPAVVKVAENYFHFSGDEKSRVVIQDGRVYVKRAGLQGKQFDYIVLDAFNGDYIPAHLMTREFFQEIRKIMSPEATLIANTFSRSDLADHEAATYQAVFDRFYTLSLPGSGNRILLLSNGSLASKTRMHRNMISLSPQLKKYGVNARSLLGFLNRKPKWKKSAKVLTDQYSPVNVLNER